MLLKQMIDEYYKARGLVQPNAEQALLWLISEVGELAGAYRACCVEEETRLGVQRVLHAAVDLGLAAEAALEPNPGPSLSSGAGLKGREFEPNVGDEVGDVLMMLERFSQANGNGDVVDCLIRKMQKKLPNPGPSLKGRELTETDG